MTRFVAPRHHLFHRLVSATSHMLSNVDCLAGALGPSHLMFVVATALVAVTHRNH